MNIFSKIITGALLLLGAVTLNAQEFPTVVTGDASDRQGNSAVLNGSVSLTEEVPFGQFYFQYGRTTSYGSQTARRSVSDDRSFSQPIQGLNQETGYNFRAVLIGSNGVSYFGSNKSFVTPSEIEEDNNIPGPFETDDDNGTGGTGTAGTGTTGTGTTNSGGGSTNTSGTAQVPAIATADDDGDGIPNNVECPTRPCANSDGDELPDFMDSDSDQDGTPDRTDDTPYIATPTDPQNPNTTAGVGDQGTNQGGGIVGVGGFNFGQPGTSPTVTPNTDAENVVNEGIVPCGNSADPSDACKFQDVIEIIQNIINFIVVASIFVGVALIVYGGILYMRDGGSSSNVSKAKGIFMNVAVGYFFVLCAWLIVNFIVSPQSEGGSGLINDDFQAELDSNNLDLLQDN